jgi:hypothetical protein
MQEHLALLELEALVDMKEVVVQQVLGVAVLAETGALLELQVMLTPNFLILQGQHQEAAAVMP